MYRRIVPYPPFSRHTGALPATHLTENVRLPTRRRGYAPFFSVQPHYAPVSERYANYLSRCTFRWGYVISTPASSNAVLIDWLTL